MTSELQAVQSRLEAWLAERRPDPTFGAGVASAEGVEGQVRHVLAVTRLALEGIDATVPDVTVKDLTKYDAISASLPSILDFTGFSLAEVTFDLRTGAHPGVRLWLDRADEANQGPRITLIAFEDVVQWRVTHDGEKISKVLLTLELDDDEVRAVPSSDESGPGHGSRPWQAMLLDALLAPVTGFEAD